MQGIQYCIYDFEVMEGIPISDSEPQTGSTGFSMVFLSDQRMHGVCGNIVLFIPCIPYLIMFYRANLPLHKSNSFKLKTNAA